MDCSNAYLGASAFPARAAIRIGFVPLCDCAPLVVAHELGYFEARGLRVELSREVGWATIRDKIVLRELEAAHAPAAMVLGLSLGIGAPAVACLTGLVLNLHGNAVTLSNRLWNAGVRDNETLREFAQSRGPGNPLTFGIPFSCASHGFLLQKWLRAGGLEPRRDLNVVVLPPPQMAANLRAGNLDGYCVGEPWNSVAVARRAGWIAATSPDIAPGHPEKVLLVRSEFAEARAAEHGPLIAALREACEFCQVPENRPRVAQLLARPKYLGASAAALQRSLCEPLNFGKGNHKPVPSLHLFAGSEVNEPGPDKAAWVRDSLVESGGLPAASELDAERLALMFRLDLFLAAAGGTKPKGRSQQPQLNADGHGFLIVPSSS